MKYIYGMENIKVLENTIVILGNFDGIHIGHQRLFNIAKQVAKEQNLKTVLFSFFPHPTWILGTKPKALLMSREEKKDRIEKLGVDIYVEYPFSLEFSQMSAKDFITKILLDKLNCKAVCVGNSYFFGKDKEGSTHYMKELAKDHNFEVYVVDEIKEKAMTISSTYIRDLLLKGDIALANKLMGQPYMIQGKIVLGKQLGRTLGFPTVNLIPDPVKVLPPNGVYITRVHLLDDIYYGLTNIGYNPTVNGTQKIVETYVFDFCQEVYGKEVKLEIIKYMRSETKFSSLAELTKQMNKDKCLALEYIKHL